jgi:drug/metabolite transporter (DMT)-like permease
VLYFSLICAIGGLATWPFGWETPSGSELVMLIATGICGGLGHILLTESYRRAAASVIAPFDYTSMLWTLLLGFIFLSEVPSLLVLAGVAVISAAGLLVIWRERRVGGKRIAGSG